MAEHGKGNAVRFYIIIAVILMVLTYLEFAIVEYEFAWINSVTTIIALVVMSLLKFALVVAIYMHLRDDDPIYTRFFSSGLVIALGTFIALSFLFTVRSVMNTQPRVVAQEHTEEAAEEHGATLEDLVEERTQAELLSVPAPKTQRVQIPLPEAQMTSFSLKPVSSLSDESNKGSDDNESRSEDSSNAETAGAEASDSEANDDNTETNSETESSDIQAQGSSFDWQELGESTYTANCVACHQANGEGIPGAFPPLAGHIPNLYNAEGGRDYIIQTVLYGLMGEIEVNGTSYNSAMTPWAQLSDEQIAATLNHELSSWGNDEVLEDFSPILPDEVAALRDQGLSSTDVLELRPELP